MTLGILRTKDRAGADKDVVIDVDGDTGAVTPIHLLDAAQHQALIDALDGLARMAPTIVDISGEIEEGGEAQVLRAGDVASKFLFLQNPKSATESLWVQDGKTTGGGAQDAGIDDGHAVELAPGESYTWPAGIANAVSIIAATTGHKFIARKG